MFDAGTVIGINAGTPGNSRSVKESALDEQKELREIFTKIEEDREKLDDLVIRYDAREKDTAELDK